MESQNIKELIPQREPFIMVDRVLDYSDDSTETSFKITEDNVFCEAGFFYEGGIIENIAQTVAAGAGSRLKETNLPPSLGVVGSVKNFEFIRRPKVGEELTTKVNLISDFGNALVIFGEVFVREELIAHCRMNVFIVDHAY